MESIRDISRRAQEHGLVRVAPPVDTQALVPAPDPGSPLPVFSGEQMREAFQAYRLLQDTLDRAMPDAIMKISGRLFRKKNYWRAVRTAFNLNVVLVSEQKDAGEDDWGWVVTYRATAPNGRSADGDGACYASEKTGRGQATEHNVRSHAHTRAFNRAVSNLVGFGEVSAEEADRESRTSRAARPSSDADLISDEQVTRFWVLAKDAGWPDKESVKDWLLDNFGLDSSRRIPKGRYDEICDALHVRATITADGPADLDADEIPF